jgi:hypothetical protein
MTQDGVPISLGNESAEAAHNVTARDTDVVGDTYPDVWIMAARASEYVEGHEPYRVVDGEADTNWHVRGDSQLPGSEQWIELNYNQPMPVDEVSINWLGEQTYDFAIYSISRDDYRAEYLTGKSQGQPDEFETYTLPKTIEGKRGIRIGFQATDSGVPAGIKKCVSMASLGRQLIPPPPTKTTGSSRWNVRSTTPSIRW